MVQLKPGADLSPLLQQSPLPLARTVTPGLFILQAPDAWAAAAEAQRLAAFPEVRASYPIIRRQFKRMDTYAPMPNDPFFGEQWFYENRDSTGQPAGADLNARAAWGITQGEGTVIAVADDGIELAHPEFVLRSATDLHHNFGTGTADAEPSDPNDNHGTAVSGFALAEAGNQTGITGMAPKATPASWKIFAGSFFIVPDEGMMDLYQYRSNVVGVQNHSWGNPPPFLGALTPLEDTGISNAVTFGREGRGVVMVRAGGNGRPDSSNANDDGYANDPRAIAVAGTGPSGRVATSYSSPGACLLVAAPGGETNRNIFTTDRMGENGYNTVLDDNPDYAFESDMMGTSFACPQVAGLAALLLSANPALTYRDVQHILLLSARHLDLQDPDVKTNAAGLLVSHNVGFGLPDAGEAVRLARLWPNRPPAVSLVFTNSDTNSIPDDGLRVLVTGEALPEFLASVPSTPCWGPNADQPTATLPIVDVGYATTNITEDLTGKAALIERGQNMFAEKIDSVARAGAAFAVIFNNTGTSERLVMSGTDFTTIPAVMIDQTAGVMLREYLAQTQAVAQIKPDSARCQFVVTNTLLCEHIGVRVRTDHTRRGDLRITLQSPRGTISVLQQLNFDFSAGPQDWTYYTVHDFLESSAGTWTVAVTDQQSLDTGSVLGVDLIFNGVPITDTDQDALDDDWEMARFGLLAQGPRDDPDGDGYNNARELVMGTDPLAVDIPFVAGLVSWNTNLARLSWPGLTNQTYEVQTCQSVGGTMTNVATVPGRFPQTEWFTPRTNLNEQFFRIRIKTP